MHRVFVYGTLKRGFPYHETGLAGQCFIAPCRTCQPYPLVIGGPWFSPILIDEPGSGLQVLGELYGVDDATLAKLDRMEGTHLPTGYRRVTIAVEQHLEGGAASEALTYVKDRSLVAEVHSEPLAAYHPDPRYVLAADRDG